MRAGEVVGVCGVEAVSYTHLDVYKRQRYHRAWMGRLIGWGLLVLLAGNAIAVSYTHLLSCCGGKGIPYE